MSFAANDHIIAVGDMPGLIKALALKGAKPRIYAARRLRMTATHEPRHRR